MMPREGAYGCARGCGEQTAMPGICAACGSRERRAEARREFAAALDSIPLAFRWAAPGSEDLRKRSQVVHTRNGARLPGDIAERIAMGVATGGSPFWTLRGQTGVGKTSVICAAMNAIVDAAVESWLAVPLPGSRRQAAVEPATVRVARGMRFIPAIDLMPPQDRGDQRPAMFGAALHASILFLDDMGKELSAREDAAVTALRAATTRELIEKRWYWRKPTVLTLALSNDAINRNYDGGTFRRIAEDKQVKFVDWGES